MIRKHDHWHNNLGAHQTQRSEHQREQRPAMVHQDAKGSYVLDYTFARHDFATEDAALAFAKQIFYTKHPRP